MEAKEKVQPSISHVIGTRYSSSVSQRVGLDFVDNRPQSISQKTLKEKVIQRFVYAELNDTQAKQVDAVDTGLYYHYAPKYEEAVGAAAFVHPLSMEAASDMSINLSKLLRAFTLSKDSGENHKDNPSYSDYLSSGDKTSSGSVPNDQIGEVLTSGNLRERMTLVFSTALSLGTLPLAIRSFIGGGTKQKFEMEHEGKGKAFYERMCRVAEGYTGVKKPTFQPPDSYIPYASKAISDTRGVFRRQTSDLPPGYKPALEDNMMVKVDAQGQYCSPEIPLNANPGGITEKIVPSRVGRTNVAYSETPRSFWEKGAPLSSRELINQFGPVEGLDGKGENRRVLSLMRQNADKPLAWQPGDAVLDLVPDAEFTEQMDKAKVIIKTTASSSADYMMKIGKYLYADSPQQLLNVRAAILGWMLPTGDHSYWEILFAASESGTQRPPEGPAVYNDHAPMSDAQITKDNPNILFELPFKNVLSEVLFPSRPISLQNAISQLMPKSVDSIKPFLLHIRETFKGVPATKEIDNLLSVIKLPRVIVEQVDDPNYLRELCDFVKSCDSKIGKKDQLIEALTTFKSGDLYAKIKGLIGRGNMEIVYSLIISKYNLEEGSQKTPFLCEVGDLLCGEWISSIAGTRKLGFESGEVTDIPVAKGYNSRFGPWDRGKWLDSTPIDGLRNEQFLSLLHYTGNDSTLSNYMTCLPCDPSILDKVRANDPEFLNVRKRTKASISGLQALPPYDQGRVYRGERNTGDFPYHIGQVHCFQKLLSTSKSYEDSYAVKPESNIAIIIDQIKTGVDIQLISNHPQEREVLFPPYAHFVVTRIEDKLSRNGKVWVYMDEIE